MSVETGIEGIEGYWKIWHASKDLGDPFPDITAAQWALESGWGKRMSGSNNPFGQKGRTDRDSVSYKETWEVINGKTIITKEPFKNYDSLTEALKDRHSRWVSKYKNARNLGEALDILIQNHYATDPNYKQKIFAVIRTARKDAYKYENKDNI